MAKTLTQPNNTTQSGSVYKAAIDDSVAVLAEIGQDFAPHQSTVADLNVLVDAGKGIKADGTLVEQSQQSIAFTAPTVNPRIDRIVVDMVSFVASRVAGTEAASPVAPAIPPGKFSNSKVSLTVGQTQITNINITDERTTFVNYDARYASTGKTVSTKTSAYTITSADNNALIVATSGTWTLSLTAASTLGSGFWFEVLNTGSGLITIDPNSSETVNGATTIGVGPGGRIWIVCTGSLFYAHGNANRGALALKTTNQTINDLTTTTITFNSESYDTDAIHDNSTNTGRLTVPVGVNAVRLAAQVDWSAIPTGAQITIYKNGTSTYDGRPLSDLSNTSASAHSIVTPVLYVTGGDYFEVVVIHNSGASREVLGTAGLTWFSMEIKS